MNGKDEGIMENYDGQNKSEADEVLGSMRVAVVAVLASGAVMVGGLVVLIRWITG